MQFLHSNDTYTNVEDFHTLSLPRSDLAELEKWLKTLPSHNQKAVSCGSSTLDEPMVEQIEDAVEKLKVRNALADST